MSLALFSLLGVALDAWFGEPRRWHPLVGFGNLAQRIEQRLNSGGHGWRSHGVTGWCMAVLPPVALVGLLSLS
ncbi:MAG: cobalamin biosynthesis protein, partial [Pseudomonas sp.]